MQQRSVQCILTLLLDGIALLLRIAAAALTFFVRLVDYRVNYQWMNLVTVHWYKATKETPNTVTTLLDEGPIRDEMANLQKLVAISRK